MKTQCFVKTCNGQGPHENRTEEGVRNVASGGGLFVFHHPTMGMLQSVGNVATTDLFANSNDKLAMFSRFVRMPT